MDQRLYFHEQGPSPLQGSGHDGSNGARSVLAEKELAGVGNFAKSTVDHLEHTNLVDTAKSIFDTPENPVVLVPLSLHIENRIDHMLESSGAGQGPFLRHMPDEQNRDLARFCQLD